MKSKALCRLFLPLALMASVIAGCSEAQKPNGFATEKSPLTDSTRMNGGLIRMTQIGTDGGMDIYWKGDDGRIYVSFEGSYKDEVGILRKFKPHTDELRLKRADGSIVTYNTPTPQAAPVAKSATKMAPNKPAFGQGKYGDTAFLSDYFSKLLADVRNQPAIDAQGIVTLIKNGLPADLKKTDDDANANGRIVAGAIKAAMEKGESEATRVLGFMKAGAVAMKIAQLSPKEEQEFAQLGVCAAVAFIKLGNTDKCVYGSPMPAMP